jgi:predicted RNA-binding Zn-ribbon protein involved in translation (DUF1610 family)
MGYKSVCLHCKKAFSQGTDFTKFKENKICPDCGKPMTFLSEKFQPPPKTDDKKWEVVRFFVNSGFDYSTKIGGDISISYNETLTKAKELVFKYKELLNKQKNSVISGKKTKISTARKGIKK